MRGSILPVFVSPRQCAVICLSGSDLRNPHHEYKFHFQFSTYRSVRWTSAVLLNQPATEGISAVNPSPVYNYPRDLELARGGQFFAARTDRVHRFTCRVRPASQRQENQTDLPRYTSGRFLERSSEGCIHLRAAREQLLAIHQRKCDAEPHSGLGVEQNTGVDIQLCSR
jgi:hypothetical protein